MALKQYGNFKSLFDEDKDKMDFDISKEIGMNNAQQSQPAAPPTTTPFMKGQESEKNKISMDTDAMQKATDANQKATTQTGAQTGKSRDFGASAIVALVVAAAGTAASVAGSADSTEAAEEEGEANRRLSAKQFKEQMDLEKRKENMKGLDYLMKQRESATIAGRSRNFSKDLLTAARQKYGGI